MEDCKGCGQRTPNLKIIRGNSEFCCRACALIVDAWLAVRELLPMKPGVYTVEDELESQFLDELRRFGFIS